MSDAPADIPLAQTHASETHRRNRPQAFVAIGLVATLLLGATALVGAILDGARHAPVTEPTDATATMPMVAPDGVLDLSSVSGAVAAEYRYAADHASTYAQFRCWCGCEKAFDHRSLADCFVRADGAWEAHGAGCGICMSEALTAHARLDAGTPTADIARDLDTTYGPNPTAAGAPAPALRTDS